MSVAQQDLFDTPSKSTTLATVQALKSAGQDFNWYPTTPEQIACIAQDIATIFDTHEISDRYEQRVSILDVGAGDGRVLTGLNGHLSPEGSDHRLVCELLAVEKAPIHTTHYRGKGISLIGTEFNDVNFVSKAADIAFCNPPYEQFSYWMSTLVRQLKFKLMYAILPERWENDSAILEAIKRRGIVSTNVIARSDFFDADRQARCKVHIIRFAFNDFEQDVKDYQRYNDDEDRSRRTFKPRLGRQCTDPFLIFIEDELGLRKTHNSTTEKFSEHYERERIRREMDDEATPCHAIVKSEGILHALLMNYDRDLTRILDEYTKISALDGALLAELGVDYENLVQCLRDKLFGFRHVYWSLLFDELTVLSSRLTSANKTKLLNTLSATALDFTLTNALYVIDYAVSMANELIEESLVEVYRELTSEASISRHYKSNVHMYSDRWRHNSESPNAQARYLLDYRFVSSHYSNFSTHSWEKGLNDNARRFCDDLIVALTILGYDNFEKSKHYDEIVAGDKLIVHGTDPSGQTLALLHIRFYKNGNRHIQFLPDAMLRLNVTASRILGWVRSRDEFAQESDSVADDSAWQVGDSLKILPSNVLALTVKRAA